MKIPAELGYTSGITFGSLLVHFLGFWLKTSLFSLQRSLFSGRWSVRFCLKRRKPIFYRPIY